MDRGPSPHLRAAGGKPVPAGSVNRRSRATGGNSKLSSTTENHSFFLLVLAQPADSVKKRPLFALAATATAAHDAVGPFLPGFSYYASAGMKKERF